MAAGSFMLVALLDETAIRDALAATDWRHDGEEIVRVVEKKDFAEALDFVNRVGALAESANHHPDIDIRWNKVTLRLSTHSEGGITQRDLDLAREIDSLRA